MIKLPLSNYYQQILMLSLMGQTKKNIFKKQIHQKRKKNQKRIKNTLQKRPEKKIYLKLLMKLPK